MNTFLCGGGKSHMFYPTMKFPARIINFCDCAKVDINKVLFVYLGVSYSHWTSLLNVF